MVSNRLSRKKRNIEPKHKVVGGPGVLRYFVENKFGAGPDPKSADQSIIAVKDFSLPKNQYPQQSRCLGGKMRIQQITKRTLEKNTNFEKICEVSERNAKKALKRKTITSMADTNTRKVDVKNTTNSQNNK